MNSLSLPRRHHIAVWPSRWPTSLVLGWWLLLATVTLLIFVVPDLKFAFRNDELSYGLATFTVIVASLVAFAAGAHFVFEGRLFDLGLAAAFVCIAVSRIWFGLILQIGDTGSATLAGALLYGWFVTRLIAGILLLLGLRKSSTALWPLRQVIIGLAVLLVAMIALDIALWKWSLELPRLVNDKALLALSAPEGEPTTLVLHGQTILGVILQLALSTCWVVVAVRMSLVSIDKRELLATLALITTAVAEIQFLFYPAPYHRIITTADILWLTSYIFLLTYLAHQYVDRARKLQRQYRRAASLLELSQTYVGDRDRDLVVEAATRAARAVANHADIEVIIGDREPRPLKWDGNALQSVYPIEAEGTLYGTIVVRSRRTKPPSHDSNEFLCTVANQTARLFRAIDLYAELESSAARNERLQLARELHDGLAQDLAVLRLKLEDTAGELSALVERALSEARYVITVLRGQAVTPEDFVDALNRQAEEMSRRFGCPVRVQRPDTVPRLSMTDQTTLLRIAREAVTNAGRHARPTNIRIVLSETPTDFRLEVTDDGLGFDSTSPLPPDRYGLLGMRERVDALGGRLEMKTVPGQGTTVSVLLPARGRRNA